MKEISFKKVKFQIRIIVELAAAIIIAFIIDCGVQYSSFKDQYQAVSFGDTGSLDENGKLVYSLNFDKAVYVKKIKIKAESLEKNSYTVYASVVNDFGKTETMKITDKVYPEFSAAYTNIGAKVSDIQVKFSAPENINVLDILCLNGYDINGCRIVFFSLVVFLSIILIAEKELYMDKIHIFYLIFALGFGSILIFASGPVATTWDEEVHYQAIYTLNLQHTVEWNAASRLNCTRKAPKVNTQEELQMLYNYMNDISVSQQEQEQTGKGFDKGYIIYLPMVAGCQISKILGAPYTWQYTAGRLGNLLFCTILNCFVIYIARRKKLLIAALSLMPTLLFQTSMYTYDGVIFVCMNLGFVLWMNQMECTKQDRKTTWKQLVLIAVMFGVGCIAKPVYFPAMFLLIPLLWSLIKERMNDPKKRKKVFGLIIGAVAAICLMTALVLLRHVIVNLLQGNRAYGGDPRGGETSVTGQLLSMIRHPVAFCKMLIHEIFTMDNLRNFGKQSKNHFLPTNLMFLNLYGLGMLKDAWSFVLLPVLGMLFLTNTDEKIQQPKNMKMIRLVNGAVVLCSVILIWTAMYLAFTPVGETAIDGVQARYFLPLILPAAYALNNNKIRIEVSQKRYYQIILGMVLLLTSVCLYQTIVCGRLI